MNTNTQKRKMRWKILGALSGISTIGPFSVFSHAVTLAIPSIIALIVIAVPRILGKIRMPLLFIYACLVISALISCVYGFYVTDESIYFAAVYLGPLVLLVFLPLYRFEEFVIPYVLIATFVISIWMIFYQLVLADGVGRWQITGIAGSGNLLAAHLNMLWPVCLYFIFEGKLNKKYRKIGLALVMLAILSVLLSFSRIAFATAITSALVINIRLHPGKFVYAVSLVIVVLFVYFLNSIVEVLEAYRFIGYESQFPRSLIWKVAVDSISVHWLWGVGPGGSRDVLLVLDTYHAHNSFVQIFLEIGILPFLVMCFVAITIMVLVVKYTYLYKELVYLGLSLMSYLVYSMVSSPITRPSITFTFAIIWLYFYLSYKVKTLKHKR